MTLRVLFIYLLVKAPVHHQGSVRNFPCAVSDLSLKLSKWEDRVKEECCV